MFERSLAHIIFRFFIDRSTCSTCLLQLRHTSTLHLHHNSANIAEQMKQLNKQKQFHKTIEIFDSYARESNKSCSRMTVMQALKACAHLRDRQRGQEIHRALSKQIATTDPFIMLALIQLYSRWSDQMLSLLLTCFVFPFASAMWWCEKSRRGVWKSSEA